MDTKLFPCGHSFHGECLIQWVNIRNRGRKRGARKFNCPLCRQDIAHFIQMTGNQAINDQLIQIWNEHNLFSASSSSLLSDEDRHKLAKVVEGDLDSVQKTVTPHSETFEEIAVQQTEQSSSESVEMKEVEEVSAADVIEKKGNLSEPSSVWKFLWKSPLSLVSRRMNRIVPTTTSSGTASTDPQSLYVDRDLVLESRRNAQFAVSPAGRFRAGPPSPNRNHIEREPVPGTFSATTSDGEEEAAFWKMTPIHFKAGLWAGLCAGSTTYLLTMGGRSLLAPWALRGALAPILMESTVSVSIFFTSYEHCKRYLFAVDNERNSRSLTFMHRFVSAGIASSLSLVAPSMRTLGAESKGLLPFRFATFFGTFELCKDVMNVRHEQLGLLEVASAAAIGGTVSHGLYYPLLQSTRLSMGTVSVEMMDGASGAMTREIAARNLYRGWMSSWSKFLPSCVVCSCAFEYGKRYLSQ